MRPGQSPRTGRGGLQRREGRPFQFGEHALCRLLHLAPRLGEVFPEPLHRAPGGDGRRGHAHPHHRCREHHARQEQIETYLVRIVGSLHRPPLLQCDRPHGHQQGRQATQEEQQPRFPIVGEKDVRRQQCARRRQGHQYPPPPVEPPDGPTAHPPHQQGDEEQEDQVVLLSTSSHHPLHPPPQPTAEAPQTLPHVVDQRLER